MEKTFVRYEAYMNKEPNAGNERFVVRKLFATKEEANDQIKKWYQELEAQNIDPDYRKVMMESMKIQKHNCLEENTEGFSCDSSTEWSAVTNGFDEILK